MIPLMFAVLAFAGVFAVAGAVALRAAQESYEASLAMLFFGCACLAVDAGYLYEAVA